jgi:hypothetical protein
MKLRRTELFGATAIIGGALIAFACSGGEDYPSPATGGTVATATGGTTGGAAPTTGGVAPSTGGTVSNMGGTLNTGGTLATTGGTVFNTGGTLNTGGKGGLTGTGGSGGKSGAGGSGGKSGAGGSGGKSGTGGSGGAGTVTYSQVVAFIRTTCGSCHANAEMPNLNTQNPTTLYTTLTTVTVRQCGGNKLVTANDPSKSALLMVGTDKCTGLKMPAGCTETVCFDPADVTMLTTWIQQGAKNP